MILPVVVTVGIMMVMVNAILVQIMMMITMVHGVLTL
jgi:hypothetical protein